MRRSFYSISIDNTNRENSRGRRSPGTSHKRYARAWTAPPIRVSAPCRSFSQHACPSSLPLVATCPLRRKKTGEGTVCLCAHPTQPTPHAEADGWMDRHVRIIRIWVRQLASIDLLSLRPPYATHTTRKEGRMDGWMDGQACIYEYGFVSSHARSILSMRPPYDTQPHSKPHPMIHARAGKDTHVTRLRQSRSNFSMLPPFTTTPQQTVRKGRRRTYEYGLVSYARSLFCLCVHPTQPTPHQTTPYNGFWL